MAFSDFKRLNKDEFIEKFNSYARKINIPEKYYPTIGNAKFDSTPNIEFCKGGYYYVVMDRGNENRRYTALTDELLYWVFKNAIFYYLLESNISGENSRNIFHSRQINLLNEIEPAFAEQAERDIRYQDKDFEKIDL